LAPLKKSVSLDEGARVIQAGCLGADAVLTDAGFSGPQPTRRRPAQARSFNPM
jgi:hypothetical protein